MAEKKKMSVAEILAAARKAGDGQAESASEPAAPDAEPAAAPSESEVPGFVPSQPVAPSQTAPAAKPKSAAAAGGKPSVADILAMARAAKAGGAAATPEPKAAKPAAKAATEKPALAKPAAKATDKPAAKVERPVAKDGDGAAAPRDTSSILAAARSSAKAGPMSKAEAAVKLKPQPSERPAKASAAAVAAPPAPAKPDYARPKPPREPVAESENRRSFLLVLLDSPLALGFFSVAATLGLSTLAFARFMFPNILMEPPNKFKVGFPSDFPAGGVEEKYKPQFGVWVVNTEYKGHREIVALKTVCTHLGCTPNWLEAEQKFKCPCHGSGFYKDGINFEGPAPRPLERYAIRVADDGQLEVDKTKTFQEELGQWNDPASFVTA